MRRRAFLGGAAAVGVVAGMSGVSKVIAQAARAAGPGARRIAHEGGPIRVAFVLTEGANVIDFAGPWEVFQDVMVENGGFELSTVSDSTDPITATAGLKIVPQYTYATAPRPKVVVVGAQSGRSAALMEWLRHTAPTADVTMSVCTGAFVLGRAGLLAGKSATTHHEFWDQFHQRFPDVKLERGVRFVEGDKVSSAGGLTSGIDLALRVVERYYGREVARRTATYMEYQSTSWMV